MKRFLIIDTETGGFDPQTYSILALGAVVWERNRVIDQVEFFVAEPQPKCDPEALKINRIDLDWLAEHGEPPDVVVGRLEEFLKPHFSDLAAGEGISLVGHNVQFDVDFVKRLYRLAGRRFAGIFSHRVIDTSSVLRFLILAGKLPLSSAGSSEAFEYFQIPIDPDERHTALADARATSALLDKLIDIV